ncbi:Proline HYdroxylase [Trichostrongylus colubriformis]|uniref:Proline HYdroxylase n=1 Tax=Trichostrongylus colubriformis TaxID=6319 RepID=A0AAN8G4I0_TRICO
MRNNGCNSMSFTVLFVLLLSHSVKKNTAEDLTTSTHPSFVGEEHWKAKNLDLCENMGQLNDSLSCYSHIINYQWLNVEVLSEDPILIIYRDFASEKFVTDFLADARQRHLKSQEVVDRDKMEAGSRKTSSSRIANGTWMAHEETIAVAKMFKRAKMMLPAIDFQDGENWQILSYFPGGHYAPHYDYLDYKSPEQWDQWYKNSGDRFATFFLMLQPAIRGGGTVFPKLNVSVKASAGDAVFWTNMDATERKAIKSIHGGCTVWEGEKLAATLWIRSRHQQLLHAPLQSGRFDIEKLIHPRLEYMGVTRVSP